jgi:hypothetical protein
MRRGGAARRAVALASALVATLGACGGSDDADGPDRPGGAIEVRTSGEPLGAVDATDTSCRFDGDRQLFAKGIVRNAGDKAYHVSVSVRFLDADGVRVEIASDSVSDLKQGEAARWDASVYADDAGSVVACELSTQAT